VALLLRDGSEPILVDTVLSSLKGVETEVLAKVLQGKSAPQATPPAEAVTMLSAVVAKSGDAAAVQRALDVAADAAHPIWQRKAILEGLDAGLPAPGARAAGAGRGGGRGGGGGGLAGLSTPGARATVTPGRGVTLANEPASLTKLASGTDALAPLAKNVSAKLDWTGKPAPPPPPAVIPLTPDEQKRFDAGKQVFLGLCAGCHNDDGQGKEKLGPSLVTSKYVQAAAVFPIRILTGGKEGTVGLMPPVIGMLNDDQIAAVLTYIRREWGHTASAVTPVEVREARQSTLHKGPWTETELSGMLAAGGGRGRGGQ
jgi:mono/diheme cytochrome c family protein